MVKPEGSGDEAAGSGSQYLGLKFMGSTLKKLALCDWALGTYAGAPVRRPPEPEGEPPWMLGFFGGLLSTLSGALSPMFD